MKKRKIEDLILQIEGIIELIILKESSTTHLLDGINPRYLKSARNLCHYSTFRKFDFRPAQKKLKYMGLTRLSNAEGHILASLIHLRKNLFLISEKPNFSSIKPGLSIKNSTRLLHKNTKDLLGYRSKGRRVRIMVTLPSQAAHDYEMVLNMAMCGMNCARINCAHDDVEIWKKMISNVKKASKKLKKKIKISMDLAGPKIRTGKVAPGPQLIKFRAKKDEKGKIVTPATLVFVPKSNYRATGDELPIADEWFANFELGALVHIEDAKGRNRKLKIVKVSRHQVITHCRKTCYISSGATVNMEASEVEHTQLDNLPSIEQAIILRINDIICITKEDLPGSPSEFDEEGNIIKTANISCQLKAVFGKVKSGEKILFDDGKIEGVIISSHPDFFEVKITKAKLKGSKLKAEKGINFPESDLGIGGLTEKDIVDLKFIAQYADVVNFSFVNTAEDVDMLLTEIDKLDVMDSLGIILKIETQTAFENLIEIVLAAMKSNLVGVMVARGDLAVEVGWEKIARIQSEIVSICSAAHIPVVWATQVLESLVKDGIPSRSEITDVNNALKAECIMLNKGPYINDALLLLSTILSNMEDFHNKNNLMLPKLQKV
ncbi:MAG: pyruvate kinase [Bacteroidota bacterium]